MLKQIVDYSLMDIIKQYHTQSHVVDVSPVTWNEAARLCVTDITAVLIFGTTAWPQV